MEMEIDIQLTGKQIFDLLKDGFFWMHEFDEPEKLEKWIRLFSDHSLPAEYNEIDGDVQINELEDLFKTIIKEKRNEFNIEFNITMKKSLK